MTTSCLSLAAVGKSYTNYTSNLQMLVELMGFNPKLCGPISQYSALSNISFDISSGERVGFVGQNGAGKSTLLKIIAGKLSPSGGSISRNYKKIHALLELGTGFDPEFTGEENVIQFLRLHDIHGVERTRLNRLIAAFSELGDFYTRPFKTYSSGMQARLAFSAATHIESDLLILDETLAVGDAYYVGKCIRFLREELPDSTTVLFVSHDLALTQQLCDRVIWLKNGCIQADGPTLPVSRQYLSDILGYQKPAQLSQSELSRDAAINPSQAERDSDVQTIEPLKGDDAPVGAATSPESLNASLPNHRPVAIHSFYLRHSHADESRTCLYLDDVTFCVQVDCLLEHLDLFPVISVYLPNGIPATELIAPQTRVSRGRNLIEFACTPLLLGQGNYVVSVALFETIDNFSECEQPSLDMHDRQYKLSVLANPGFRPNTSAYSQPFNSRCSSV